MDEVHAYLGEKSERICLLPGDEASGGGDAVRWWLRTSGASRDTAFGIDRDGTIIGEEDGSSGLTVNYGQCAVRPALWLEIRGEGDG